MSYSIFLSKGGGARAAGVEGVGRVVGVWVVSDVRWCCCEVPVWATVRAGSPSPPGATRSWRYIHRSCVHDASAHSRTVAVEHPYSTPPLQHTFTASTRCYMYLRTSIRFYRDFNDFCVTFAESEPYCDSILFVCLSGCLSVIPRPTAYHDWSITTKLVGPVKAF